MPRRLIKFVLLMLLRCCLLVALLDKWQGESCLGNSEKEFFSRIGLIYLSFFYKYFGDISSSLITLPDLA
jgi:hypothetical protein